MAMHWKADRKVVKVGGHPNKEFSLVGLGSSGALGALGSWRALRLEASAPMHQNHI